MLLGQIDNANVNVYAKPAEMALSLLRAVCQDSFKVSRSFTLSYGLRWEVDAPRYEAHDNTSNISLTAPNPAAGGLPGALVFAGQGARPQRRNG